MAKVELTNKVADAARVDGKTRQRVLPGFGLTVSPYTKTFFVYYKRKKYSFTPRYGSLITVEQARAKAKQALKHLSIYGVMPPEEKLDLPTLLRRKTPDEQHASAVTAAAAAYELTLQREMEKAQQVAARAASAAYNAVIKKGAKK